MPIPAPDLPYRPAMVRGDWPIGVIGCGAVSSRHLASYRKAGFRVTALCDRKPELAEAMRDRYFPRAMVFAHHGDMLKEPDIQVVDITTHPGVRPPLIRDALLAGKHVLSQKPFVSDLNTGVVLADLADSLGLRLAVNQNGRWASHIGYLDHAIRGGYIGKVSSIDFSLSWDHGWISGTPYEDIPDLILWDHAIHWFDFVRLFMGGRKAEKVTASVSRAPGQTVRPPLRAEATVTFEGALAHLRFDGSAAEGAWDRTTVVGESGTLTSEGPDLNHQSVILRTRAGEAWPDLQGRWFNDGFHGAMAELLSSLEEGRVPSHNARENLDSLELCLAAIASAREGRTL